ncbi:putative gag-polypeptide of LTR copia-type [Rosa chinensis]|uniref:Putative gag-polypeptide of LTR copia-type n=1 Tax=Rosa chinensis TaxID=74649 RepID=A0A2P6R428_ROSCH|nr:putative gag-polypeptide of LTR copia-type [Rosa chinensis]
MGGDESEGQCSKINEVQKIEVSVRNSDDGSFGGPKLNGTNFRTWKKIMSIHLSGIHKMGHVNGTTKAHSEEDADAYAKWEDDDGSVMALLFKAMTEDVLQLVEECETAEMIWKTLGDLYTNESDFIQVHELMCKAAICNRMGNQ